MCFRLVLFVLFVLHQCYNMCLCLCICIGICLTLHLCYRYEDFFGKKELSIHKKEISIHDKDLSTHEREQLKLKAEIEQREKAMLDPKTWTMQGEVCCFSALFYFTFDTNWTLL